MASEQPDKVVAIPCRILLELGSFDNEFNDRCLRDMQFQISR